MLKQYSILSSCLSELKASSMPTIEKLKLEVQLIQTKRILLDKDVEERVMGVASSEQELIGFYDHFRQVCSSLSKDCEVDEIVLHLGKIKESLEHNQKECNSFDVKPKIHRNKILNVIKTVFKVNGVGG
jgi:hypothetical protein